MRIAHVNNIAGVAWQLAQAQRRLGHEAVVFTLEDTPYQFPYDVRLQGAQGPLGWNATMFANWRRFSSFDVLHVHFGIWKSQVFYPLFRRFKGKTLVVHYHGDDVRMGKGVFHSKWADLQFHATPDLAKWLPHSVWVPNPIDLPEPPPDQENSLPRFGHFVSSPISKGTDRVVDLFRRAFGPLKRTIEGRITKLSGSEAELWVIWQLPHQEALEIMRTCDAVIDQIAPYGIYGMVAIEAMSYGKPVFGTPRLDWYPGCPVVPMTLEKAADELKAVAFDTQRRRELGEAGREYVARVHEAGKVARQVLKAYYAVQKAPPLNVGESASYWKRRGFSYASEFAAPNVRRRYDMQSAELLEILDTLQFTSIGEIGCGFARIGRQTVERYRLPWVGADISRGQLLEARRGLATIRPYLVEASADSLPFDDSAFDLVLSVEMLMHIPPEQIGAVLRELWRIASRYVVHLDWFEDYMVDNGTGWCWIHDYESLWRSLGAVPKEIHLRSTGIQSVFVVTKRGHGPTLQEPLP